MGFNKKEVLLGGGATVTSEPTLTININSLNGNYSGTRAFMFTVSLIDGTMSLHRYYPGISTAGAITLPATYKYPIADISPRSASSDVTYEVAMTAYADDEVFVHDENIVGYTFSSSNDLNNIYWKIQDITKSVVLNVN